MFRLIDSDQGAHDLFVILIPRMENYSIEKEIKVVGIPVPTDSEPCASFQVKAANKADSHVGLKRCMLEELGLLKRRGG